MTDYSFTMNLGYPLNCCHCANSIEIKEKNIQLLVKPYYQIGCDFKLMLIGQDPTIFNAGRSVNQVLMLDETNSQLRRWLENLLGKENFENFTVYATNAIKCTFPKPPSTYRGKHFLQPYFDNCKGYLEKEILSFLPNLVLSFGEPTHRYLTALFDNKDQIGISMQSSFGQGTVFFKAKIKGYEFNYSPCLHIKTFRVAETYGNKVKNFKDSLQNEIKNNQTKL